MRVDRLADLPRLLLLTFGASSLLLNAGCQSTSADSSPANSSVSNTALNNATTAVAPIAEPRPVVVRDFLFDEAQAHAAPGLVSGREGPAKRVLGNLQPEEPTAQEAARRYGLLSETIPKELSKLKIPANRETPESPWPTNAIVVGGQFLQADQGNRLGRARVGFDSGATEALVQVAVYDLLQTRSHPILVLERAPGPNPRRGRWFR